MVLLNQGIAEGGFDTPQRQQRAALDAVIPFDPCKQRFVLLERFPAGDDAPVRDAAIDVLPDLLVEFGLLLYLPEHGHVRLDASHHPCIGRVRDALGQRPRTKAVAPLIEAGRCGRQRGEGVLEQGPGRERRSQQGAARRCVQRIRLFHQGSLASGAAGGAAKAVSPAELAILLRLCGNFGHPARDHEPGRSRRGAAKAATAASWVQFSPSPWVSGRMTSRAWATAGEATISGPISRPRPPISRS